MSKDFNHFLSDPKNFSDYEGRTQVPLNQNYDQSFTFSSLISIKLLLSTGALSLLTAPLTTSSIALQISNPSLQPPCSFNYKPIINELLAKTPKKSPEIMKRLAMLLENNIKNSQNLPFKAAQYASYRSAFRGLSEQGVLGLYKGNLTNVFYLWIGTIMKVRSGIFLDDQKLRFLSRELSLYLLYTSIDIALHPLQSLQTRLILQNRNKKMALYRNVSEFFKAGFKRKGLFFQGALIHLPKNFFIIAIMNLNQVKAISNVSNQNSLFILSSILANVVSYPFITLMRRIMCQDLEPFMLERRYIGMKDGFKKMIKEEGVLKGPWRGFGGFFVVSSFMLALNFTYHQTGMF